jgi:hypothetical protein
MNALGPIVYAFFEQHLNGEKGLSPASVKSYRDALRLFLTFIAAERRRAITRLEIEDLTAERVRKFLSTLEKERGNCIHTRNQRSPPCTPSSAIWRASPGDACRSRARRWYPEKACTSPKHPILGT